ncbi:MAG: radical SAM protein [Deltaproteobacteria bacterium]|nr:radical SAM protein [Deltaproteobacteria bacterium]
MRIALVSPPRPADRFINRDLFAGMGIDDCFGTGARASFVAYLKAEGTVIPEIAFPLLAALLRTRDVRFFDGARVDAGAGGEAFEGEVAAWGPGWVLASTSLANLANEVESVVRIGRAAAAGPARTVVFGFAASALAEDVLARGADFVIDGEVEAVAPELVAATDASAVRGLVYAAAGGRTVRTGRRLVEDPDSLPFPDWGATPLARYAYFPLLKRRPFATLLSSRGCTYGCAYCPYCTVQGAAFRACSPDRVVAEMAHLAAAHGVRSVLFRDPNFALDRARVLDICRLLADRGPRLDWGCETRLDLLDDEVAAALGRAGCRSVEVGMDAVSPEVNAAHGRKAIGPVAARERLAALRRHGVASAGLFVIGLPGDTEASIRETIRYAAAIDLDYASFQVPIPFPGTPMYARAVRSGAIPEVRLDDLRGRRPRMPGDPGLPPDRLEALRDEAVRSFYVRPGRVLATVASGEILRSAGFLASRAAAFVAGRLRGRR